MTSLKMAWHAALIVIAGGILAVSSGSGAAAAPAASVPQSQPTQRDVLVGAIRWDGWNDTFKEQRVLDPKQWHYRLPFFAKVVSDNEIYMNGNSQEVMDREINYAADAGIDYWAFNYYAYFTQSGKPSALDYGRQLYLSSQYKSRLKFCYILSAKAPKRWSEAPCDAELIESMKDPHYLTVLDGRPVVYFFDVAATVLPSYGTWEEAHKIFDAFRAKCKTAGMKDPYIVGMLWAAHDVPKFKERLGVDGVGAYTACGGPTDHREYPYSVLARINRDFWDACKSNGGQVIPVVNTGSDGRPRLADPKVVAKGSYKGAWFAQGTPKEIADNLADAVQWVRKNPKNAETRCVLIYAWNENSEGGWLTPTLDEGDARLQAIKKALGR